MLSKTKPILYLISFCFSIIILLYSSYIGIRNIFRYNIIKSDLESSYVELSDLQHKNIQLRETLISLESSQYWELLSKRKLGYKKKGEVVYMIVAEDGVKND